MKDTKNSPLQHDPILDENGMLSDPGQLREIVSYLGTQLQNITNDPALLLIPGMPQTIDLQVAAIHMAVCADCAEARAKDGTTALPIPAKTVLEYTFKAYLNGQEMQNAEDKKEDMVDALFRSMGSASTAPFN